MFKFSFPKGASTPYLVFLIVAMVMGSLWLLFAKKAAIVALLSNIDFDAAEAASDIRASLSFPDSEVTGIKYLYVKDIFSVGLDAVNVNVECTAVICIKKYHAIVPHGIPYDQLRPRLMEVPLFPLRKPLSLPSASEPENADDASTKVRANMCAVKKKFGSDTKITICAIDKEIYGKKCCSLNE